MDKQESTQSASRAGAEGPSLDEHITLTQAANLAPGRPTLNCVWRWCREGIKAASGDRVRLKHTRFGSRIFTTRQWLNDFGQALAGGVSAVSVALSPQAVGIDTTAREHGVPRWTGGACADSRRARTLGEQRRVESHHG